MEAVDKYAADNTGPDQDFRLDPSPSWLKICQPQACIPQTADMIPGMYFTREHFQRLRDDPRLQGPRGTRFGYANAPAARSRRRDPGHLGVRARLPGGVEPRDVPGQPFHTDAEPGAGRDAVAYCV